MLVWVKNLSVISSSPPSHQPASSANCPSVRTWINPSRRSLNDLAKLALGSPAKFAIKSTICSDISRLLLPPAVLPNIAQLLISQNQSPPKIARYHRAQITLRRSCHGTTCLRKSVRRHFWRHQNRFAHLFLIRPRFPPHHTATPATAAATGSIRNVSLIAAKATTPNRLRSRRVESGPSSSGSVGKRAICNTGRGHSLRSSRVIFGVHLQQQKNKQFKKTQADKAKTKTTSKRHFHNIFLVDAVGQRRGGGGGRTRGSQNKKQDYYD